MNKLLSTRNIASIAILSALAGVLMFIDFPLGFIAPTFYKLDLSDLPCLIGTFSMGPLAGVLIELLKILIKLILKPTSSAFVGELSNFLCGIALVIPAGLIYHNKHNKKGATLSLIVGSICMVVASGILNYTFIIPTYVKIYGMPLEAIIGMGQAIFPIIKDKLSFVLLCTVPFNLIKAVLVAAITRVMYKRISPLLKGNK